MQKRPDQPGKATREGGYSLIEVLIAMGLLATVLLTIITLFFLGRGNVYSGKQMSFAVALGTRITEDLSSLTARDIYLKFGIADGAALSTVSVAPSTMPESSYTGSILRDTSAFLTIPPTTTGLCSATPPTFAFPAATKDSAGYLAKWQCQMLQGGTSSALQNGSISLVFTPRKPDPTASALSVGPTTGTATVLRVRVILRWVEGSRSRQLITDSTKFRIPNLP